jgi:hypothetical protein
VLWIGSKARITAPQHCCPLHLNEQTPDRRGFYDAMWTAHQIGRKSSQALILALRPAVLDRDVSALSRLITPTLSDCFALACLWSPPSIPRPQRSRPKPNLAPLRLTTSYCRPPLATRRHDLQVTPDRLSNLPRDYRPLCRFSDAGNDDLYHALRQRTATGRCRVLRVISSSPGEVR